MTRPLVRSVLANMQDFEARSGQRGAVLRVDAETARQLRREVRASLEPGGMRLPAPDDLSTLTYLVGLRVVVVDAPEWLEVTA